MEQTISDELSTLSLKYLLSGITFMKTPKE